MNLEQIIAEKIHQKGPITFAEFMEDALYHPHFGYYTSLQEKVGKKGDYYTAPHVHHLFGETIAEKVRELWSSLEGNLNIIEFGPGEGFLAYDILSSLKNSPYWQDLTYFMVEKSPYFIEKQRERLKDFQEKVFWRSTEELPSPINACVLSNELLDSFPVHRVIFRADKFQEVYVDHNGFFFEKIKNLSSKAVEDYLQKYCPSSVEEEWETEVNLAALNWLEEVSKILRKGFLVTIDYGLTSQELSAPPWHKGTLLSYYKHRTSQNPYEHIGEQDITAHVNFTSLIKRGEELGLKTLSYSNQANFLLSSGLLEKFKELAENLPEVERVKTSLALKTLLLPQGMGERFKVLVQEKS